MIFKINDYKGEVVMHCKSIEEAESFCFYLDSVGRTWRAGNKYSESTMYSFYKEETCYNFNEGTLSPVGYFKERGYSILEWSDFMNDTMSLDCKNCLFICECCCNKKCDSCKPFGCNFNRDIKVRCRVLLKKLL